MSAAESDIYNTAYRLYDEGRYKDASSLFTQLALKDPFEESYWRGLAAARQMERKFEAALHAWALVAILAEKDPWPHFHAAECYFALRDNLEANKALNLAEDRLKNEDPLHQKIRQLRQHHATTH